MLNIPYMSLQPASGQAQLPIFTPQRYGQSVAAQAAASALQRNPPNILDAYANPDRSQMGTPDPLAPVVVTPSPLTGQGGSGLNIFPAMFGGSLDGSGVLGTGGTILSRIFNPASGG